MKLLRIGASGQETSCVLDPIGTARDVSGLVGDFTPETIATITETLAGADLAGLPKDATDGARIGTPMTQPRNIYCIGLNYCDHAAEAGLPIPAEPILFSPKMTKLDWEVELGIVIGKPALNIEKDTALDHVLG